MTRKLVRKKPNFFIIGAPRAGTTSLYFCLKDHPDIFMSPRKEPRFFAFEDLIEKKGPFGRQPLPSYSTSWEKYLTLFEKARHEKVIGEASTMYLYHPKAPERMQRYLGSEVKLVAVLRHPVERAFSHYLYNVNRGAEPCLTFEEALAAEEERIAQGWIEYFHYKSMGLYSEQVKRYLDIFGADNLLVFLYEDLDKSPLLVVKKILEFLGLEASFLPDTFARINPSGIPRFKFLTQLIKKTPSSFKQVLKTVIPKSIRLKIVEWELWQNIRPVSKPRISLETRKALLDYYQQDILKLQQLLGRDLSHWLKIEEKEG